MTYEVGSVLRYEPNKKNYVVVHAGGNRIMLVSINVWRNERIFGHRHECVVKDLDAITADELRDCVGSTYFDRLVLA